jgi:hypothetical protein
LQVPKVLLQPVPQWPVVEPHQPYWLQQLPKLDPTQVKPLEPPQLPSVDAFLVATGAAALVVVAAFTEVAAALPEQMPKEALQLVQWSASEPHQPYWEQQFPKVEPEQVKPEFPPQEPSVEAFLVPVAAGAAEVSLKTWC